MAKKEMHYIQNAYSDKKCLLARLQYSSILGMGKDQHCVKFVDDSVSFII